MISEITVKQLKKILADVPDEALVVLSRDIAGNAFSPATICTAEAIYVPGRRSWDTGEAYTKDDPGFEQYRGKRAVVIWPIH